jgi:hypothetical protein
VVCPKPSLTCEQCALCCCAKHHRCFDRLFDSSASLALRLCTPPPARLVFCCITHHPYHMHTRPKPFRGSSAGSRRLAILDLRRRERRIRSATTGWLCIEMRRVTPLVIDSIRPANSLTMHHHDHRWTNYLAHIPRERRVPGELHGAHSAATRGRTALLPAADACAQHHGTDGRRARHPTAARGAKWRDECGGPDSTHAPAVSLPPHLGARCAATQSALAPAMCRKVDSPPSTHTRLGTPGGSFAHAWRPGAAIDINPPSKLPAVALTLAGSRTLRPWGGGATPRSQALTVGAAPRHNDRHGKPERCNTRGPG